MVDGILQKAEIVLWQDHLKTVDHAASPHKARFISDYRRYCLPMLSVVILEWFELYGCEENYKDFYAWKLSQIAENYMMGKCSPAKFKTLLQSKPDVKIRYFYDSDAWEDLNDEMV